MLCYSDRFAKKKIHVTEIFINSPRFHSRWLMGTKLKQSGARCLFPVFGDTVHKSVFSVSITRSKEMIVLSNMPLRTLRDA